MIGAAAVNGILSLWFVVGDMVVGTAGTNTFQGWTGPAMTENQIVMRGDRLPTSTNVEEYCCNGRVLHKNSDFAIYQIPERGVIGINSLAGPGGSEGNGDLDDVREFYNNNLGWLRSNTKCQ